MAIDTRTVALDNTSDATFRAWASAFDAALLAVGLVATTDTGQVDLTTVLKPALNTSAGYRVYRFADALQATAPVFIKLEFGVGASSGNPSLWVTVGTGTNGAGALTGQVGTRTQLVVIGSVTPALWLTSGNSGRLTLAASAQTISQRYFIVVERTRDNAGAEDATGVFTLFQSGTNNASHQVIPFAGAIPGQSLGTPAIAPTGGATLVRGANTGVTPLFPFLGGLLNPVISAVSYTVADIANDTQVPISMYGAARNYRALVNGSLASFGANYGGTTGVSLAMLWE